MNILSVVNLPRRTIFADLTLISDAKARTKRFAICDGEGRPVYYRRFLDCEFNGEQSSSEMAAAQKAVWLAAKVKNIIGADVIQLTLKVDAQWLTWANEVAIGGKRGGKARALGHFAQKMNVVLCVEHIRGTTNPADQYTVASGSKKWQDNDWNALVKTGQIRSQPSELSSSDKSCKRRKAQVVKSGTFGPIDFLADPDLEDIQEVRDSLKKLEAFS